MSDNEKMLIVYKVIVFSTQKTLCVQNFIKLQVFSVEHSTANCLGQWFIVGAKAEFVVQKYTIYIIQGISLVQKNIL